MWKSKLTAILKNRSRFISGGYRVRLEKLEWVRTPDCGGLNWFWASRPAKATRHGPFKSIRRKALRRLPNGLETKLL